MARGRRRREAIANERGRLRLAVAFGLLGASAVACVDLFHSTSFDTLCSPDAAFCADPSHEAGPSTPASEASTPDPTGPIDFCRWSPDDVNKHATQACALLGACDGTALTFGECSARARIAFDCALTPNLRPRAANDAFWKCMAAARTCGDVNQCLLGKAAKPTCGTAALTTCASDTPAQITCLDGGYELVEPCTVTGRVCDLGGGAGGAARCVGSTTTCVGTPRCDESRAVICNGPADNGFDCAGVGGGTCALVGDAGPACVGQEAGDASACSDNGGAVQCVEDASVAQRCIAGQNVRVDCSRLELSCTGTLGADPTLGLVGACARSTGSNVCAGPDQCSGNTLTSCGLGRAFSVDCARDLGLGPCLIDPHGNAVCTNPPP